MLNKHPINQARAKDYSAQNYSEKGKKGKWGKGEEREGKGREWLYKPLQEHRQKEKTHYLIGV
jgi:hypothetical protein